MLKLMGKQQNISLLLMIFSLSLPVFSEPSKQYLIQRPVDVYKSPTCGCCGAWVDHMNQFGFKTRIEHPQNLDALKSDLGIQPQWRACHTAVNSGYVFEGHIPADVIQRFLAEKPEAIGLAVPGMPMGSPGMDVSGAYRPYEVLQINKDGSSHVYARVTKTETTFVPSKK